MNLSLLKTLCRIHAPSGNETAMTEFLVDYINRNKQNWKVMPVVYHGDGFQDAVVLVFGNPRTAVYAHIDNIGFTVRYQNQLVKIGGPKTASGYRLSGTDSSGEIKCQLDEDVETHLLSAVFDREIDRGTDLSFECDFRSNDDYVQSCYLDNRLGVWVALQLAETLQDGAIVFSCWEEHGGGSAAVMAGFLYREYRVRQALICDITWVTEGVHHGHGVAVSLRDSGIPRRAYVNRIMNILKASSVPFQLEVESSGGSDGNEIQRTPYPVDWCFVGAPEDLVHSPDEKVHKSDIISMLQAYRVLLEKL